MLAAFDLVLDAGLLTCDIHWIYQALLMVKVVSGAKIQSELLTLPLEILDRSGMPKPPEINFTITPSCQMPLKATNVILRLMVRLLTYVRGQTLSLHTG